MDQTLILVTDYPLEAESIETALRAAVGGREVRVLADQDQALELIELRHPDAVFSHLRSGALASTLFLNEAWKRNPRGARFLVDSFADQGTLARCMIGAHQFLELPLDPIKVESALDRAEAIKRFVRNEQIQMLVSRMRSLPTKPSVYLEVMKEVRSPAASATSVGALVAKDLTVSTKLLQMANSPLFGLNEPVLEVSEAVMHLGLETTVSVILSIEAFAKFDKVKPNYFSADRLWKHSQVVADLTKRISQMMTRNQQVRAQSYLAALLHDVGKLAFAENFGEEYQTICKASESQTRHVSQIELENLRATHADAGAYLLALWGLPVEIVEAVADHHAGPGALRESVSPATFLHLAEELAHGDRSVLEVIERYPPELGLREQIPFFENLLSGLPKPKNSSASLSNPSALNASLQLPPSRAGVSKKSAVSRFVGGLARLLD